MGPSREMCPITLKKQIVHLLQGLDESYVCITSVLQAEFQEVNCGRVIELGEVYQHCVCRELPRNGVHYKIGPAAATQ